jgi:hypothetical protein
MSAANLIGAAIGATYMSLGTVLAFYLARRTGIVQPPEATLEFLVSDLRKHKWLVAAGLFAGAVIGWTSASNYLGAD